VAFRSPGAPLLSNRVNDVFSRRNGQVWIATDSGAAYFQNGSWGLMNDSLSYILYSNSAPPRTSSKVNCIAAGRDGSVWFGLAGGGIRRYSPGAESGSPWITYRTPQISFNVISGICCEEAVNGDIWATTLAAGINRFIPSVADPMYGSWTAYTAGEVPEFGSSIIETAEVNPLNRSVWIASQFRLTVYLGESGGWRQVVIPAPYDNTVVSIAFDEAGRVWFGKVDGVSMYDQDHGVWTHFTHANTGGRLPAGRVNAVVTRGSSLRWFGTEAGLVKLEDTTWSTFNRSNLGIMTVDTVTSISYDGRGNLWIGTPDGVLVYHKGGTTF
jgi:ligand-binding sensor domain-containing protein